MSHNDFGVAAPRPVRTVAEAGTYIASVCFKHGPPRRTGIELEWLLFDPLDPGRRPSTAILLEALGQHAPRTLSPDGPGLALPAGGLVSVEPGGQLEISSAPSESVSGLIAAMTTDVQALTALLEPTGFALGGLAGDPVRLPHRILNTPRYEAMAAAFDCFGNAGRAMMCSTAAAQVCVDLGTADTAGQRWRAAHHLGPVLLAAFANSERIALPAEASDPPSMVSHRMASWWRLDPQRTRPPQSLELTDYISRALDTQVLARRRPQGSWLVDQPLTLREWISSGEPIDTADVDLHLSMLFPPVRPQGYLELRYLDAQPAGEWIGPLALIAALFAEQATVGQVIDCCSDGADRWQQATEIGLADPVLRRCAGDLYELAGPLLGALGLGDSLLAEIAGLLQRRLGAGINPAMDARAMTRLPAPQLSQEGSR